ncbi:MAG: carbohydrate-binding domain-containing protein [Clostridia bacterium]|nr:carbohydrate-binding domain-containing protein [Clostridia bacterium]
MIIIKKTAAAMLALLLALMSLSGAVTAENAFQEDSAASSTNTFTFSNSGITASVEDEESYSIDGTTLKIKASGTYTLTGSCSNGRITVKKGTTGVTLVLNDLDLKSADSAPILCNKGSEVNIQAASGTVNKLTDTSINNDDAHPENTNAENAVIKAKDGSRLTLSGSGTLIVTANGKNGIKGGMDLAADGDTPASSASLTIKQLTLNVTANVNDAIKSEQLLSIQSGKITVSAAGNAIRCDRTLNIGQSGNGPTLTISSSSVGLSSAVMTIAGGNISINSTSDGIKCANSELGDYPYACNIKGGTITVNSTDGDGIDSNGTLSFAGGSVTVFSSEKETDSPLESVKGITLQSGTLFGMGSAGMVENPSSAKQVYVTFGKATDGGSELNIPKGSTVKLAKASGGTLFTTTAPRKAGYIIFSSPNLSEGMKVKLYINGSEIATATAGYDAGDHPGVPGTPEPTSAPTAAPTLKPTAAPTAAPTNKPTSTPAPSNTPAPTAGAKTPEPTSASSTVPVTPTATAAAPDKTEAHSTETKTETASTPEATAATDAPEITNTPETDVTNGPNDTDSPKDTAAPDNTEAPIADETEGPEDTAATADASTPVNTDAPDEGEKENTRSRGFVTALIAGGAAVLTGAGTVVGIIISRKKKNAAR